MKYLSRETSKYVTNFTDELLSIEWKESELENDELKNYKAKAEYYIDVYKRQYLNIGQEMILSCWVANTR